MVRYTFITICYIILMLLCKNNNIRKVKKQLQNNMNTFWKIKLIVINIWLQESLKLEIQEKIVII
jgi:hypothetical protein